MFHITYTMLIHFVVQLTNVAADSGAELTGSEDLDGPVLSEWEDGDLNGKSRTELINLVLNYRNVCLFSSL